MGEMLTDDRAPEDWERPGMLLNGRPPADRVLLAGLLPEVPRPDRSPRPLTDVTSALL